LRSFFNTKQFKSNEKTLKIVALLSALILSIVAFLYLSKPLQVKVGIKAEALTDKIQAFINQKLGKLLLVSFTEKSSLSLGQKRNLVR
jgi:hypothetical protein